MSAAGRAGTACARAIVLLAAWLPGFVPATNAQQRVVSLDAETLTQQMATRFPLRRCLSGIACITLTEPRVTIRPDSSRIFVRTRGQPRVGEQALPDGIIELGAEPRFEAASGQFFLDGPELSRFSFPGVAPESVPLVAGLLRPLLTEMLARTPVWALDENDPQQALARLLLREVFVRDGRLHLVLGDNEEFTDEGRDRDPDKPGELR